MLEASIRTQRSQERLLKGILGGVAAELSCEIGEHFRTVFLVEALEGRDPHRLHHGL